MAAPVVRAIQSRQNTYVKALRAALQRPGRGGEAIGLEGAHLIHEAIASGLRLDAIFVEAGKERLLEEFELQTGVEVLSVSREVLASVVSTESPQPLAALAQSPVFTAEDVFGLPAAVPLVIVTAGLQDPGNMGTLIRSAEAFGATGILMLPGTVSPWNAKTLRASSGSAFRLPLIACENQALLSMVRERKIPLLAAVAHGDGIDPLPDLQGPVAILIGNEGAGLSQVWIQAADACITIPYPGRTESLNAAVAGSVLLYEAARQRAQQALHLNQRRKQIS